MLIGARGHANCAATHTQTHTRKYDNGVELNVYSTIYYIRCQLPDSRNYKRTAFGRSQIRRCDRVFVECNQCQWTLRFSCILPCTPHSWTIWNIDFRHHSTTVQLPSLLCAPECSHATLCALLCCMSVRCVDYVNVWECVSWGARQEAKGRFIYYYYTENDRRTKVNGIPFIRICRI